jgi:hypothetical protein
MKRLLSVYLILWLILTYVSIPTVLHAQTATASPTPFPGNTVVNVSPGSGTISAAVNAHGGNTTYMLQNGTFIENNISVNANHMQFIGSGAPNVRIQASGAGAGIFNGGSGCDFVQVWGVTIDLAVGNGSAIGGNFSDLLFQNVHVQNYSSIVQGQEDFPVYLFATAYSPNNLTIDHCQFTPASSGNVDGTSVIATGAYRPADQWNNQTPANYTNVSITNNQFDTPTDRGTSYYHCVGSAQQITGNVFIAPTFTNGMFWYEEAGSWNGRPTFQSNADNTSTMTGNTVTLAPNWDFAGVVAHANGNNDNLVITGNTIHGSSSSGSVVAIHPQACPSSGFAITSATITNNAIDSVVNLVNQGCTIGQPLVTSPNNGVSPTPTPKPTPCLSTSANDTVVTTAGPTITDSSCKVWALTSGGQVSLHGSTTATNYTSGVTKIAYVSGVVWQYNGTNWYSFAENGSMASGPTSTSPLPAPTPTPTPKPVPTPVPTPKPTPTPTPIPRPTPAPVPTATPLPTPTAAPTPKGGTKTPAYVQGNYATPQTGQTIVGVPFNSAQLAGDTNVVFVGWNDTTSLVNSVTRFKRQCLQLGSCSYDI